MEPPDINSLQHYSTCYTGKGRLKGEAQVASFCGLGQPHLSSIGEVVICGYTGGGLHGMIRGTVKPTGCAVALGLAIEQS